MIPLEVLWIPRAEVDGGGDAAHDSHFVRVDERPRGGEADVVFALQEHHPGDDEEVVREGVAELVPPVFADDLAGVDVVDAPQFRIARFVQEDCLEDVLVEVDFRRELALVICAIKTHFELGAVGWVFFDVVHWLEGLFGHFDADGLVDARK